MPPRHHKTEEPGPIQNTLVPNGSQVRSVSARHRSGWSLRNRRHLAPSRYDVPGGKGPHRTGVPVPPPHPSLRWEPRVRTWTKDIRTPGCLASLPCRSRGTDLRARRSDRANHDFRGWTHARRARHPRADHPSVMASVARAGGGPRTSAPGPSGFAAPLRLRAQWPNAGTKPEGPRGRGRTRGPFAVGPARDAWVVGDESCAALDW